MRPIGQITQQIVAELRFRRQVEHLHRLGPRAVGELLLKIGRDNDCMGEITIELARYAQLAPNVVVALDADQFASRPIHVVQGNRR